MLAASSLRVVITIQEMQPAAEMLAAFESFSCFLKYRWIFRSPIFPNLYQRSAVLPFKSPPVFTW